MHVNASEAIEILLEQPTMHRSSSDPGLPSERRHLQSTTCVYSRRYLRLSTVLSCSGQGARVGLERMQVLPRECLGQRPLGLVRDRVCVDRTAVQKPLGPRA